MGHDQQRFLGFLLARQNPWNLHHHQHLKVATGAPHCHKAMLFRNISCIFTFTLNPTAKRIDRDVKHLYSFPAQIHHSPLSSRAGHCPGKRPNSDKSQCKALMKQPNLVLEILQIKSSALSLSFFLPLPLWKSCQSADNCHNLLQ